MDADSFIKCIKTNDIYKDRAEDAESRFDTSNYPLDKPLLKEKVKKIIWLMKVELFGEIMTEFVGWQNI